MYRTKSDRYIWYFDSGIILLQKTGKTEKRCFPQIPNFSYDFTCCSNIKSAHSFAPFCKMFQPLTLIFAVIWAKVDIANSYIGVDYSLTFNAAETYCQEYYNSSLAIITTNSDNDAVYNAAVDAGIDQYFWVGATDCLNESVWVWNDGTRVNNNHYTNWKSGEPGGGISENCLQFRTNKEWDDEECDDTYPFVCNAITNTTGTYFLLRIRKKRIYYLGITY